MKKAKLILAYVFGAILLMGVFGHIVKPEMYAPMIPSFISENLAHIFAIIFEGIIGIMLFIPKYRKQGALGFAILMLVFLPIHIWDYSKEAPMIGSKLTAFIRIAVQVLFIIGGWWIYKSNK